MIQRAVWSRRVFLKRSAQAATAAIGAPSLLAGCKSSANEKVQLGFIGLGWRFSLVMKEIPRDKFALAAFCDVYDDRLQTAKATYNKDAAAYRDYRDLLASDKVDAVVVAVPDHWHARVTIDACEAGKDVYVEKPLSLTITEGRAMVDAARKSNRIVQAGTQQRSRAACVQGCQSVLDGVVGKITEVHTTNYPSSWDCDITEEQPVPKGLDWDRWLGQTPLRAYHSDIYNSVGAAAYADGRPKRWGSYTPWAGGVMTAWGAHGFDTIQWALGKDRSGPVEAWPELGDESAPIWWLLKEIKSDSWKEGRALTCPVHFKYADSTMVHLDGKGPGFGGLFVGEGGSIMVDRDLFQTKRTGEEMKTVHDPEANSDGTTAHMIHWFECIKSRKLSRADVEVAHRSCTMCHIGNIVRWLGRKVTWDPKTETFGDDEEANRYLRREGRQPWGVA